MDCPSLKILRLGYPCMLDRVKEKPFTSRSILMHYFIGLIYKNNEKQQKVLFTALFIAFYRNSIIFAQNNAI
jgi:hypothetical protein